MRKLFQTQCLSFIVLLFLVISIACIACGEQASSSPRGYNIRKPVKSELGKDVNEISGLTYNAEDTSLLAVSDSKRKVFELDLLRMKLKDYSEKIYKQEDFEDLVKIDTTIYVLISNGTILAMPLQVKDSSATVAYPFWSEDKNDFETMYYDSSVNSLVLICKTCEVDKDGKVRTAYRFDLTGKTFDSAAFYTISRQDVKAAMKNEDADFKPSAAAIHPIDKRLFILSSAGMLLVIADTRGNVQEAYSLNPDLHPQSEGIAFAPNGTMYISNEGKYGKPTLLMFPYRAKALSSKKNKQTL